MATSPIPKVETETLLRGDSRTWTDTFEENTGTTTAPVWAPLDLSGWTFVCEIRADLDRGTLLATLDVDDTDAATGVLVRKLSSTQADLLPGQEFGAPKPTVYMDLQGTRTSDGFRQTWKRWKVTVEGDVSND
jgi:hypothetical protein